MDQQTQTIIIGAGPAGLTAGYLLSKQNHRSMVIEMSDSVGGISRTPHYKNFYFDIGGHRFFSKSDVIEKLWDEMLPQDFLQRPRTSRIYYNKKFYSYPLKPFQALRQLGVIESMACLWSYIKAKLKPQKNRSFADWTINHFGERLYLHFFKTYTEKIWGMPCDKISADWAAQRIQGLSLIGAIKNAFIPKFILKRKKSAIKTLINSFRYPRRGPGQLWESCAALYEKQGGVLLKNTEVLRCDYLKSDKKWKVTLQKRDGTCTLAYCDHLISSMPIKTLVTQCLSPKPDDACLKAASQLRYRDFLIVVLILKEKNTLTDNWIYIHDRDVDVGRIQNFKSWSPDMVPDPQYCSYGMEYFCNEGDALWNLTNDQLIEKAKNEIVKIGLAQLDDIEDGCVVRQKKAYPTYDHDYQAHLNIIQQSLHKHYPNLYLVGRNGLHKYNNQDHSMMTALLTVENILANKQLHNVWLVNQDDEYHEITTRHTPHFIRAKNE